MTHTSKHTGRSLLSYSWAELGSYLRSAKLNGNESLEAQLKQAVQIKKHVRTMRKKGLDPYAKTEQK